MSAVGQWIALALFIYWIILIIRLVFDFVQIFARNWEPRGILLVIAEFIYTITDPPLKVLRRVIPTVRIGSVRFDLAFLILFIGLQILIQIARAL